MIRRLLLAGILSLAGCATADPSPAPASLGTSAMAVDCGEVPSGTCREVADAAELMLGTAALAVEELDLPDDEDGLQIVGRYLVRLEADAGGDELVEVVRFTGSDNWSVRRAPARSDGN